MIDKLGKCLIAASKGEPPLLGLFDQGKFFLIVHGGEESLPDSHTIENIVVRHGVSLEDVVFVSKYIGYEEKIASLCMWFHKPIPDQLRYDLVHACNPLR